MLLRLLAEHWRDFPLKCPIHGVNIGVKSPRAPPTASLKKGVGDGGGDKPIANHYNPIILSRAINSANDGGQFDRPDGGKLAWSGRVMARENAPQKQAIIGKVLFCAIIFTLFPSEARQSLRQCFQA